MQITSLIGKQILSPAGEKLGFVLKPYPTRDLKGLACFLCVDEEEEEFYLSARTVISYGDVLIAGRARLNEPTGIPSPVGNAVYSHTGEALGRVGELLIGDGAEPLLIVHYDGTKFTYPLSRVLIGDTVIVYPEGVKAPAPVRKPSTKKKTANPTAKKPAPPAALQPTSEPKDEPAQPAPKTDVFDRVNLLGRKLKKSMYDENGELIAVAGERITAGIVSRARRCNRLLQLTVNTLTNVI